MLSHVKDGSAHMVSVKDKVATERFAHARSVVQLPPELKFDLEEGDIYSQKGTVFNTAIIAGTMAVKNTSNIIPLCHSLNIEAIEINIRKEGNLIISDVKVVTVSKTGVEMEALTGASVCALTIYDMLKALTHDIVLKETRLVKKTGGKTDFSLAVE